jgi:hypothetical protein
LLCRGGFPGVVSVIAISSINGLIRTFNRHDFLSFPGILWQALGTGGDERIIAIPSPTIGPTSDHCGLSGARTYHSI